MAMVPVEDVSVFSPEQHGPLADYIILTDEHVERSFEVRHPL